MDRLDLADACPEPERLPAVAADLAQDWRRREQAGDDTGAGRAACALGRVRWFQGRWDEASEDYRDGVALLQRAGARGALAAALHDLGFVALARGRLDEARDCFERGLPPAHEPAGDALTQGRTLSLLGLTHLLAGQPEHAHRRWHQAEDVISAAPSPDAEDVRRWVSQWIACAQLPRRSSSPLSAASSSGTVAG